MAVAERCGLGLRPVNFPGHFLTQYLSDSGQRMYLDVFNGCTHLSGSELAHHPPDNVSACEPVQVLIRMMNNFLMRDLRLIADGDAPADPLLSHDLLELKIACGDRRNYFLGYQPLDILTYYVGDFDMDSEDEDNPTIPFELNLAATGEASFFDKAFKQPVPSRAMMTDCMRTQFKIDHAPFCGSFVEHVHDKYIGVVRCGKTIIACMHGS